MHLVMTSLLKHFLYGLCGGRPAAAPVLLYHAVDDGVSPLLAVRPRQFQAQMAYLAAHGYQALSLEEWAAGGGRRRRRVLITFDDGFAHLRRYAVPVLRQYRFPAVIFVPTAYAGGEAHWLCRDRQAIEAAVVQEYASFSATRQAAALECLFHRREPVLSWEEMRELEGVGIRCHSHGHRHYACDGRVDRDTLLADLLLARQRLERHLGRRDYWFAYPYGAWSPQAAVVVRQAGYRGAFLAKTEVVRAPTPFSQPRVAVENKPGLFHFRFALSAAAPWYAWLKERWAARDGGRDGTGRAGCGVGGLDPTP